MVTYLQRSLRYQKGVPFRFLFQEASGSRGTPHQVPSSPSGRSGPPRETALSLSLRHHDGIDGRTLARPADAQERQAEVGREEGVEDGVQTAVAVGQAVRDDLQDDQAPALTDVVEVDHPEEEHDLQRRPADGEGDDHHHNHPRDALLVLLALAGVLLVPDGSRPVCGCRAAPQAQQHVHVEPHDGEEGEREGGGEEEGLVELLVVVVTVERADGAYLACIRRKERKKDSQEIGFVNE